MMSSNERFSVSSSFRLRIRFRNARSSAESFDGFLVRDIAVADLPPTSLIAQNQAFIAWCARSDRWGWGVFLNPLLARQLCGRLNDIAMPLLSLNLGGGFSVDSVCHLRDRPGLAIQRSRRRYVGREFFRCRPSVTVAGQVRSRRWTYASRNLDTLGSKRRQEFPWSRRI